MILLLLAVFAAAWFLQWYLGNRGLEQISCSLAAERCLCEPGEPFELKLTVENRSRLPVLFLRVSCSVPTEAVLTRGGGELVKLVRSARYRFVCFLMPRQSLTHSLSLKLDRRGLYAFSGLELGAGDFLGLKENTETRPGACYTVILPRRPDRSVLPPAAGGLMGERSVRRWIHEDPILSAGFREYTGREPLKNISWSRSLQSGQLMVRQMDHTAEQRAMVLFSAEGGSEEQLEACFRICRGLCEELEAARIPYGFFHNACLYTAVGLLLPVEDGLGPRHLDRILEGLGRAVPCGRDSLKSLVQRILRRGGSPGCCLLIVPEETERVRRQAALLASGTGARVEILSSGVAS